jgi:hypothetical protein
MNIKLFTMVKDEVDIVRDWILYHGYLFGFNNLFIVDNFSTDGTFEEINKFTSSGVNVFREANYINKGNIMTHLIKTFCNNCIAYPLDIDEFIVYYNKNDNSISTDKSYIINYITNLPLKAVYKTNYIIALITNDIGYDNPIEDMVYGHYQDYGHNAKSFFNTQIFIGAIDHGNHYATNNFFLTNLCLLHYHHRNLDQMKKKINNNISGLGYNPNDINQLRALLATNAMGFHHVSNQIAILENKYTLPTSHGSPKQDILLKPLSDLITSFNLFDYRYYLDNNLDLRINGIVTIELALRHWFAHGINENRATNIFDWKYYLATYSDLIRNGINTKSKALQHWFDYGKDEGRICKRN